MKVKRLHRSIKLDETTYGSAALVACSGYLKFFDALPLLERRERNLEKSVERKKGVESMQDLHREAEDSRLGERLQDIEQDQ